MRGFVISDFAHHSKISVTANIPEPAVAPDQVLVDVYSAGLNFFEILQTQGKYQTKPQLPFILGTEFCGKISDNSPIPSGCLFKPGDRVFGAGHGTFADKVSIDISQIQFLPNSMTYEQGAGLYITWPTSYEGLVGRAQLQPGEWVLVTAAAGGVGIAAVQIAKAIGARVIGAASSDTKVQIAKHHGGADYCVNYSKHGWQKEVLKITNGKGVDVIYDPVGLVRECLKCVAWKGRVVVIGFAAGTIEQIPLNLVLLKNVSLVGLFWGAYSQHEKDHVSVVWKELLKLFNSDSIRPVTYSTVYTLDTLPAGLDSIEKRESWGKVVLRIRDVSPVAKL